MNLIACNADNTFCLYGHRLNQNTIFNVQADVKVKDGYICFIVILVGQLSVLGLI